MVQSITDKVIVAGFTETDRNKNLAYLQATCHPTEAVLAKEILKILYRVKPVSWDIEIQDDEIKIWCGLHPTYGYKMSRVDLTKGYRNIRLRGQELVARIEANACQ